LYSRACHARLRHVCLLYVRLRPIELQLPDYFWDWLLPWRPWLLIRRTSRGRFPALRELQNNLVDRNRKDSLQLLRIQNDLNSLALAMRDMLDNDEPYPLTAWSAQFQRVRTDLDDALRREQQVAPVNRTPSKNNIWRILSRSSGMRWIGPLHWRMIPTRRSEDADSNLAESAAGGAEYSRVPAAGAEQ